MARGARRKGSPLNAALDTYNRLDLTYTWKDSRQVQNLVEASVLDGYGFMKQHIQNSAAGAFLLDTAMHGACENHAAPELYQALVASLEQLSIPGAKPFHIAAQGAYKLLEATGIAPDPDETDSLALMRKYALQERAFLRTALELLAVSEGEVQAEAMEVTLDFLHTYISHHFEKPLKSHAFLMRMLREE